MRTFKKVAAQGEITIIHLGDIPPEKHPPNGYRKVETKNGYFIIGHSETGHHHVIADKGTHVSVLEKPPEGMRILHAILENPLTIDHLRPFDTHESIELPPGEYEFRIGREFDPYQKLARRQAD